MAIVFCSCSIKTMSVRILGLYKLIVPIIVEIINFNRRIIVEYVPGRKRMIMR